MPRPYETGESTVLQEYFELMGLSVPADSTAKFEIGPEDCLLVIDMQNDFVPAGAFNKNGGRLGCREGDVIAEPITQLMELFARQGGMVVATRDYHPLDHCSFAGCGGDLPVHCIGGHVGSYFYHPVAEALERLLRDPATRSRTVIAFKGYYEEADSFGGLTYDQQGMASRDTIKGLHALPTKGQPEELHGEVLTGCVVLKCSAREFEDTVDVNAPPDIVQKEHAKLKLEDVLREGRIKRLFVCGLAFDYCVLDTTCNGTKLGWDQAYLVADAARPAYIPSSDFYQAPFGSGFVQDPKAVKQKMDEHGAKFIFVRDLLDKLPAAPLAKRDSSGALARSFPDHLESWRCHLAPRLLPHFAVDPQQEGEGGRYRLHGDFHQLAELLGEAVGKELHGVLSPRSPVNFAEGARTHLGIPADATHYCFVHALQGGNALAKNPRYAWCLHDPTFTLLILGGFAYFDRHGKTLALLAVTGAGTGDDTISFRKPTVHSSVKAEIEKRMQPPPAGTLLEQGGATGLAWVGNGELAGCEFGGLALRLDRDGAVEYRIFAVYK
eukprot:TRINITY_DN22316_c0_g1_i2.p1 TRINITY_DN22316_c0_g1~~TRINITY_DN22316_c0_g1_i2.p1  ORF type:complete len:552 (+),score=144.63 TRINITY_DN22316_c0_g1_i2:83-1738(+)